jgi:hypothetical protein
LAILLASGGSQRHVACWRQKKLETCVQITAAPMDPFSFFKKEKCSRPQKKKGAIFDGTDGK